MLRLRPRIVFARATLNFGTHGQVGDYGRVHVTDAWFDHRTFFPEALAAMRPVFYFNMLPELTGAGNASATLARCENCRRELDFGGK
jgi:hypothetical protein